MAGVAQKSLVKTKKFTRDKLLGLFGLVVVTMLAAYVGIYRPLTIREDKERFVEAQASLEELYTQIEGKIGKPDQVKREQSCTYASRKLEKGPLGCGVGIYLLYENKNSQVANELMQKSIVILGSKVFERLGRMGLTSFMPVEQLNGPQSFSQEYKTFSEISCRATYLYPLFPTYLSDAFKTTLQENFEVDLTCGGSAKAEHFPLKN